MTADTRAELADDLERLAQHLPCLEAAAADESGHPVARVWIAAEADALRTALKLLGVAHD